jgi:hypothetical protein
MNYARGRYYRTRYYWYVEVPGEGQFIAWSHLTPEFVCPVAGNPSGPQTEVQTVSFDVS